jgi:hypothetical protein
LKFVLAQDKDQSMKRSRFSEEQALAVLIGAGTSGNSTGFPNRLCCMVMRRGIDEDQATREVVTLR